MPRGLGVGVDLGTAVAVGVGVAVAVAVGVGLVAVAVGVGLAPQVPSTLNTMCMPGNPMSDTGVGTVMPQAGALM